MYRQQYDQGDYRPQFGGFSFFPPVIKYLIIINVVMFFLKPMLIGRFVVLVDGGQYDWFEWMFYLRPLGDGFKIWQLVSYMFLHGGIWHLALNMIMLWMFGMEVENTWGSKKFAIFYFACGLAAGLANLFIAPIFTETGPTLGASGSVYGVLVAFAMLFPNRYVYFYFFLPVKAKYMIAFFILLEVYNGVSGGGDGIAHIAHLGGAVLAAIWVLLDNRGVIDKAIAQGSKHGSHLSYFSSKPKVQDADYTEVQPSSTPRTTGDKEFDEYQKTIDTILDKISKNGYAGLTELEKQILLDASKKIHPDKN